MRFWDLNLGGQLFERYVYICVDCVKRQGGYIAIDLRDAASKSFLMDPLVLFELNQTSLIHSDVFKGAIILVTGFNISFLYGKILHVY